MSTTPVWVPVAIAVLGVAGSVTGTVVGVVLTQRRSDRREDERWARERAREHEAWAREDARRTFDQRRGCYIDFLQHVRKAALAAYNAGYELGPALEFGWNLPLYESLLRLHVFASPEAAKAAEAAYNAVWTWETRAELSTMPVSTMIRTGLMRQRRTCSPSFARTSGSKPQYPLSPTSETIPMPELATPPWLVVPASLAALGWLGTPPAASAEDPTITDRAAHPAAPAGAT